MLQPIKKSFVWYLFKWVEYSWKSINNFEVPNDLIEELHRLDDSILIIDDIFDESFERNGKPCLYRSIWIQGAIIEAQLLQTSFIKSLEHLMDLFCTRDEYRVKIYKAINEFLSSIYEWEKIDLFLWEQNMFDTILIDKYFEMIKLFTGWHIKYSFMIWGFLTNRDFDQNIYEILIGIWAIRQIVDDFEDYFVSHHEPFGDFLSHNNRLPELLFSKQWWNREKAISLIKNRSYDLAVSELLSDSIRSKLFEFCVSIHKDIQKNNLYHSFSDLIVDYEIILNKQP